VDELYSHVENQLAIGTCILYTMYCETKLFKKNIMINKIIFKKEKKL